MIADSDQRRRRPEPRSRRSSTPAPGVVEHGLFRPQLIERRADRARRARSSTAEPTGRRAAGIRRPRAASWGGQCASSSPPPPARATSARSSPSPAPCVAPATSTRRRPDLRSVARRARGPALHLLRRPARARPRAGVGARPRGHARRGEPPSSWASCSGASAPAPPCRASSSRSTRWQPDVVVRESCEFASAVAAEAREIPVARVGAFLPRSRTTRSAPRRRLSTSCASGSACRATRRATRLAASPYLTLTPASFRAAGWSREPPQDVKRFHDAAAAAAGGAAGEGRAAARVPELRLGGGVDRLLPRPLPRRHRRARRPADPGCS